MPKSSTRSAATTVILLTSLCVCMPMFAAEQADPTPVRQSTKKESLSLVGTGTISFKGFSTLHNFEGQGNVQPFTLRIGAGAKGGGEWSAAADLPVSTLNSGSRSRDTEMYKMFGGDSFPMIHGEVTKAPVPEGGSGEVTMQLRIRDQEHPVRIAITNWTQDKDTIQFHGAGQVSLSQYGLQPPSVMGMMRVKDTVVLEAQFSATKGGKSQAAPSNR